jgi:hypothetical protein
LPMIGRVGGPGGRREPLRPDRKRRTKMYTPNKIKVHFAAVPRPMGSDKKGISIEVDIVNERTLGNSFLRRIVRGIGSRRFLRPVEGASFRGWSRSFFWGGKLESRLPPIRTLDTLSKKTCWDFDPYQLK